MWALISSFTAMLAFADLGIGNGLLNSISDAYGRDDREGASRHVSSAFYMLLFISILIAVVFSLVYPYISWAAVFNVTSAQAVAEAGPAMAIFIMCILINIPLGVVQRIRLGYQEGFINSFWLAVGSVATLFTVLILIYYKVGLPYLVFALGGLPVLAQFSNGLFLFFHHKTWLLPRWSYFSFSSARQLLQLGLLFFVLQMAIAIGFESDGFIITQFLGAEAVTEYAIPKRLFILASTLLSIVLSPLWPAYNEAIARKDTDWVRRTFLRSIFFSSIFGISSALILLAFSNQILKIWVGDVVSPPSALLAGFAGWLILYSVLNPFAMFMNGASIIEFQVITTVFMTIVNIIVSIVLVQRIGIAGPIWGTVISLSLCVLLPTIWYVIRFVKKMEKLRE
jgi:O-antigen/teichoic acid export membrane protein